ncbi:MAG: tetratricopeptide repeat protein, partial [Dehalococcoidia bacterium]|nr:tetratricopeptide repeat protein [Dehalococcoidia bacterium]
SATAQAIREIEPSPENQEELLGLIRLIEYSQGFTLAFARCNQVPLRQEMACRLADALASIGIKTAEVELAGPVENLREAIVAHMLSHPSEVRLAVMVYGFEHSIPSGEALLSAVGQMNMARELYRRDIPHPLVLWLPEYALSAVARAAPEFWHWRSGVFQFTTPPASVEELAARNLYDGDTANLTLKRKQERIYVLERLLEDYEDLAGQGPQNRKRRAEILYRLGQVHYGLGHYQDARRLCHESLEMSKELGDRAGIAMSFHQLGVLAHDQGDLAEARRLYQENLGIAKELGDRGGVAVSLNNLGNLAQEQGGLAEARRLYQESLEIKKELGNRVGLAATLHSLGVLAQAQGDYAEARRLYQESLEIETELGNRAGLAYTVHALGVLAQDQGDLAEARRLYQESLGIKKELGNRAGIAISLHQLGLLAQDQGDLAEARRLYQESLVINKELGNRAGIAISLHQLGVLARGQGDLAEARRLYQESLEIAKELGDRAGIARSLHNLGVLAQDQGDVAEARRLYQESLALYERMGLLGGLEATIAAASLKRVEELLSEKERTVRTNLHG